jgi:hypothetical protein
MVDSHEYYVQLVIGRVEVKTTALVVHYILIYIY